MSATAIEILCKHHDAEELCAFLRIVEEKREIDSLVQAIIDICGNPVNDSYQIPAPVLSLIGSYFETLSAISAHRQAFGLATLLQSATCRSKHAIVRLLNLLVERVPILNAIKLRNFIKNEIVKLCVTFWEKEERDLASQLTFSILQTLLVEVSYLEGTQENVCHNELILEAQNTWNIFLNVKSFEECPLLQLSTALLYFTLNIPESAKRHSKIVVKQRLLDCYCVQDPADYDISYQATLFKLLSMNLPAFCCLYSGKLIQPICNFLIERAQSTGILEQLLKDMNTNPLLRYSHIGESVQSALALYLPSSAMKHLYWLSPASDLKHERKKKLSKLDEEQLDWDLLLSLVLNSGTDILTDIPYETMERILRSTKFGSCSSESARQNLRLLNSIVETKKALTFQIRNDFIDMMLAESEPRTCALKFSGKLLEMNAHSVNNPSTQSDFVSFCLAFFCPLSQLNNCLEEEKRDFLMAELSFLNSFLSSLPQLLTSFAPLIIQLIPEFFVWLTFYHKKLINTSESIFADRLEHRLSLVCREISRRKKVFHKFLPFAISSALTGDRELRFPMYLLLTALDENDLALLTSNLPAIEKRKFSLIHTQFYASNKIIG